MWRVLGAAGGVRENREFEHTVYGRRNKEEQVVV
jgi:hypothetical protein